MAITYRKQDIADILRRCGYWEVADEALRDLPDPVDLDQIEAWEAEHGITHDQLISQLGGSP
jgi:hypothetical protein